MGKLGEQSVSEGLMRHLERRAARIVLLIDAATQGHDDKKVRENGAQLTARILEMVEELRELRAAEDASLMESIEDFHARLHLAQSRIDGWDIPDKVKKQIDKVGKPAAEAPTRRRRTRKKAA